MIDVDWRATRRRPAKRKVTNVVKAIEVLAVEDMDSDREGKEKMMTRVQVRVA